MEIRIQILPMTKIEDRTSMEMHMATTCSLRDCFGPVDTGIVGVEAMTAGRKIGLKNAEREEDPIWRERSGRLSVYLV